MFCFDERKLSGADIVKDLKGTGLINDLHTKAIRKKQENQYLA
jgi:hypothetical protein